MTAHLSARSGSLEDIRHDIEKWCTHPALNQLVSIFGGAIPATADLRARLMYLDTFSEVWDYRGRARALHARDGEQGDRTGSQDAAGGARWQIARLAISRQRQEQLVELTRQLGLTTESIPAGDAFDCALIIGTGRFSNLLRARWTRELAKHTRIGHVVLAAASRELLESEDDAVAVCAPGARTEFELLVAAAADAFNLDIDPLMRHVRQRDHDPKRSQVVWRFPGESNSLGVPVTAIEAPSPDPDRRRATSVDTFAFTARALQLRNARCLLSTGQPFVPSQHFDAVRVLALQFGNHVETVGFGIERYVGLSDLDEQHPAKLLQEIRSTIRAARSLLEEVIGREKEVNAQPR